MPYSHTLTTKTRRKTCWAATDFWVALRQRPEKTSIAWHCRFAIVSEGLQSGGHPCAAPLRPYTLPRQIVRLSSPPARAFLSFRWHAAVACTPVLVPTGGGMPCKGPLYL